MTTIANVAWKDLTPIFLFGRDGRELRSGIYHTLRVYRCLSRLRSASVTADPKRTIGSFFYRPVWRCICLVTGDIRRLAPHFWNTGAYKEGAEEKSPDTSRSDKRRPYQNPPPYEKLVGDLSGAYSRRINIQHRLVYQVYAEEHAIKIIRLWSHYE